MTEINDRSDKHNYFINSDNNLYNPDNDNNKYNEEYQGLNNNNE